MSSAVQVGDDYRQQIEQNRVALEALGDSDLPAAQIAKSLLRLAN